MPRRIVVDGATGSGKSTAAAVIARRLGVPFVDADEIGWLPGWVPRDRDEQRALIADAAAGEAWVVDGAYNSWSDVLLPRTELIVGLDYPRWLSLGRLLARTARRVRSREPVCNGNRETLRRVFARDSIIVWHFVSWKQKRERMRAWAADPGAPRTLLFRRPAELEAWIAALPSREARTGRASVD